MFFSDAGIYTLAVLTLCLTYILPSKKVSRNKEQMTRLNPTENDLNTYQTASSVPYCLIYFP